LRPHALGHIYGGSNIFNNFSSRVQHWMTNGLQVSHITVRQSYPVLYEIIDFLTNRRLVAVFGMDPLPKCVSRRYAIVWI
jgi:hypothetical protein